MPKSKTCPECKLPSQNDADHLPCDKCKKNFHWQCTLLEDHIIKQHKYNKYKPWRCKICTEKYCIYCNKIFPTNYQESICCDNCNFWYHFHCSELSVDKFIHLSQEKNEKWYCVKCKNKICAKCNQTIQIKAKISCSHCNLSYHKNCTKLPHKNIINWLCKQCIHNNLPFSNIDNKALLDISIRPNDKFALKNLQTSSFSQTCKVCKKSLKKGNYGIPCYTCESNIHVKCSKLKNVNKTFHEHKGRWKCSVCTEIYTTEN